jgi:alpha-tubulin suppressor-like RCC1 family protein
MINAPSGLTATAIFPYRIDLVWYDNSNNEDGFEIERSTNGTNFELLTTINANVASYSDFGISPFTSYYYYRVCAFNTIGDKSNYSNEIAAMIPPPKWRAIAAGELHTIGITTDGYLWGWGNNESGQLGLGNDSPISVLIPTLISTDIDWSMIGSGYYHILSIKNNGTLWSCGANESGQLGLGDTDYDRTTPTSIGTDSDWSMPVGGANHSIAIKTNGTIWAWGYNRIYQTPNYIAGGQLGLGDSIDRDTPAQIGTDSDWSKVTAGNNTTFGIKTNGTLWAWGRNSNGTLGVNNPNPLNQYRLSPTQVGTDSDWKIASGGCNHSTACKTNGTIWGWGTANGYGFSPTRIGTDTDWSTTCSGGTFGSMAAEGFDIAIKLDGTIWALGVFNQYGQLGLGITDYYISAPAQIGTFTDWVSITTGGFHSIGKTNNNSIWVWGRNNYGQLGLGDTIDRNVPTLVGE